MLRATPWAGPCTCWTSPRTWASLPLADDYTIMDNRACTDKYQHLLDRERARAVVNSGEYTGSEHQQWALAEKLGVLKDGWYVSLVTGRL